MPAAGFAAVVTQPDEAVRVRGEFWHALWSRERAQTTQLRATLNKIAAELRADPDFRAVSGSQVKGVAWRLNADVGRGLDAWSGRELRALPSEAFDELAVIINAIMQEVSWPLQALHNQDVLVPKPRGGDRPICLVPLIVKF